ncbi:MAG TPA: endolytic transglycosylase MltG [Candidatus Paceibacterota bacterium]|nr:endolytic transglycosylase MltG [Candidatus Paceibacterota bacterium]
MEELQPPIGKKRLAAWMRTWSAGKRAAAFVAIVVFLVAVLSFALELGAAGPLSSPAIPFTVAPGDGFRKTVDRLESDHLIRSHMAFEALAFVSGAAAKFKPGTYELSPGMTGISILKELTNGSQRIAVVRIPDGASVYEVDALLSEAAVISPGSLVAWNASSSIEGRLYPDTYQFFADSDMDGVVAKLEENFAAKTASSSADFSSAAGEKELILASIVEKEVPGIADRELVAGILEKRLAAGMPLDVDATVCYAKAIASFPAAVSCATLSAADFKIDSPYNTYLHKGLPPGPIGSPEMGAIAAVENPQRSPYWFYLSDPATGKTIYAKTLEEQNANQAKYLR